MRTNILGPDEWATPYEKPRSLITFAEEALDGSDYERGLIETVEAESRNVKEAFSRLLHVLYNQKALSKDQVYYILSRPFHAEEHSLE